MNTSHPEPEALAELVDRRADFHGDTDGPDPNTREMLAHVENCPQCAEKLAEIRHVRGLLRSLPGVSMPDDVASRIEATLRAEAAKTATAPAIAVLPRQRISQRISPRLRRMPQLSAAAVVVLVMVALGGGIAAIVMNSSDNNASHNTAGSAAMAPVKPDVVLTSGANYQQGSIRQVVAALVMAHVPGSATQFDGLKSLATDAQSSAASAPEAADKGFSALSPPASAPAASAPPASRTSNADSSTSGGGVTQHAPARTAPSGPLADSRALAQCVATLTGGAVQQPVLVDYADYNGQPATIIVLRDQVNPAVLDVWVELDSGNCAHDGDTAYFGRLSAGT